MSHPTFLVWLMPRHLYGDTLKAIISLLSNNSVIKSFFHILVVCKMVQSNKNSTGECIVSFFSLMQFAWALHMGMLKLHRLSRQAHLRNLLTVYWELWLTFMNGWCSSLMVSAVDSRLSSPGWVLAGDITLCSWARHLTLTVSLSARCISGYQRI